MSAVDDTPISVMTCHDGRVMERKVHSGTRFGNDPRIYLHYELVEEICNLIAEGRSLESISNTDGFPNKRAFYRWMRENEWVRKMYEEARHDQALGFADEIMDIADDARNDYMERQTRNGSIRVLDDEHVRRSALRISSRQWVAERILNKVYGNKVEQTVQNPDGSAIRPTEIVIVAATPEAIAAKTIEHDSSETTR